VQDHTSQVPKSYTSKHYYHFLANYPTKPSACKTIKSKLA
jgi:hypothetical protein